MFLFGGFIVLAHLQLSAGLPRPTTSAVIPDNALTEIFQGLPKHHIPDIFTSRTVSIECTRQFKVFTGRDPEELKAVYAQGTASWCAVGGLSWEALFQSGVKHCDVTISPFGETYLAIVPHDEAFLHTSKTKCTLSERSELSLQLVGAGVVGLLLFALAPVLAQSIAFRISVGGFLSVLLLSAIVIFFIFRRINFGRTATVTAVLSTIGVSTTGALGLLFRFPDTLDIFTSRWLAAYIVGSFLIGMAVSYYFDNANEKIMDILSAGLRLLGITLVFYSLGQIWEVAASAVAFMIVVLLLAPTRVGEKALQITAGALSSLSPLSQRSQSTLEGTPEMYLLDGPPATQPTTGSLFSPRPTPPSFAQDVTPHREKMSLHEVHSFSTPVQRPSTPGCDYSAATAPPLPSPNHDSPLLATGHIKNASTGRLLKVGGATYNKLVGQGFVVDREAGLLSPPSRTVDTIPMQPAGGSPGSARWNGTSGRRSSRRVGRGNDDGEGDSGRALSATTSPF